MGCGVGEKVTEQGRRRVSLARGTAGAMNAKPEGPVWPDRKQSGQDLASRLANSQPGHAAEAWAV